jgi:hypothetical protein
MILDVSLSCLLKTSVFLIDLFEKIRYRKKKIGVYVPEELKPTLVKFLSSYNNVAVLDIDNDVFTLIKQEDRPKILADKSLQKVVRERLIKLSFKEYVQHFDKLVYITSNPQLVRKNFRNKVFLVPNAIYLNTNELKTFNGDLFALLEKEKDVKKKLLSFDSLTSLLHIASIKLC